MWKWWSPLQHLLPFQRLTWAGWAVCSHCGALAGVWAPIFPCFRKTWPAEPTDKALQSPWSVSSAPLRLGPLRSTEQSSGDPLRLLDFQPPSTKAFFAQAHVRLSTNRRYLEGITSIIILHTATNSSMFSETLPPPHHPPKKWVFAKPSCASQADFQACTGRKVKHSVIQVSSTYSNKISYDVSRSSCCPCTAIVSCLLKLFSIHKT